MGVNVQFVNKAYTAKSAVSIADFAAKNTIETLVIIYLKSKKPFRYEMAFLILNFTF
jgi:hypothetical protein